MKVNLKLEELNEDKVKISKQFDSLKFLFIENSNIIELDLAENYVPCYAMSQLLIMLKETNVEVLNFSNNTSPDDCKIPSLEPMKISLNQTKIKTLNLSYNKLKKKDFEALCEGLIGSSVEIFEFKTM